MMHATRSSTRGFSLIELLLSIFILGIGIISIAAVFPAGIIQQRKTQDDVIGPVVAQAAMATIRSHLSQSDFGTIEEFGLGSVSAPAQLGQTFPDTFLSSDDWFTVPGDWPWLRPSMAVLEDPADAGDAPSYVGDIDIFSARRARSMATVVSSEFNYSSSSDLRWDDGEVVITSELLPFAAIPLVSSGWPADRGGFLAGIPFNRSKYDFFGGGEDPLVTITQQERFWPAGSGYGMDQDRPQYAWDCMFRRSQGRVQVAIFVYRVAAGNAVGGYVAVHDQHGAEFRPVLPSRLDLHALNGSVTDQQTARLSTLTPMGMDPGNAPTRRAEVPGTDEDFGASNQTNPIAMDPYFLGWQAPGQWLIDPYGRTHRVVQGRRNRMQGPVRLARGVPVQPRTATNWNWMAQGISPASDEAAGRESNVRSIWFMPPSDARGIKITPVFAVVREL
jgi:prepilin-type N-terminal cleavage/methylation domain-containing protein